VSPPLLKAADATIDSAVGLGDAAIDRRNVSALGLAVLLPPQFALARDTYPSRPIHVIVGLLLGTAAETVAGDLRKDI
jgi:hypothetical protein